MKIILRTLSILLIIFFILTDPQNIRGGAHTMVTNGFLKVGLSYQLAINLSVILNFYTIGSLTLLFIPNLILKTDKSKTLIAIGGIISILFSCYMLYKLNCWYLAGNNITFELINIPQSLSFVIGVLFSITTLGFGFYFIRKSKKGNSEIYFGIILAIIALIIDLISITGNFLF